MSQRALRKYGVETTIDFELYEVDGVDLRTDWVPAAADCEIMKDGGASTQCTNTAVDEGSTYSIVLTATEMQAARLVLKIVDAATKVFLDKVIIIETYGNASAQHAMDFDDGDGTTLTEAGGTGDHLTAIDLPNQTMDITGNLSGSVGSVTGAVGSVTGNVGGNVVGTVASVVGAVGSVTGNVGGSTASVTGAVGSVAGNVDGNVTGSVGSVVGAVGSVTGAVGSVTGNVGGNVVGTVASVVGAVGSVTGNVGGSTASVTGAVGSVAGNVDGNVTGTVGGMTAGALADMFDTDSGTTYGAAVAGSVVKEIADNAAGSGGDATEAKQDTILAKMLAYFRLALRSDAGPTTDDATELTAINADSGAGGGDYAAGDAQEGIRDKVDTLSPGSATEIEVNVENIKVSDS